MKSPKRALDELNWDDLRVVVIAAEAGSLSRAARRLGISVATVGRRIDRLEQDIGRRLFHRHNAGLVPTDDGAALLSIAEQVADQVRDFARAAEASRGTAEGTVTISAFETLITHILAPRLGDFRERYPLVRLVMRSTARMVRLSTRDADIALRVVRSAEPRTVARKLGVVRFGLYGTAQYFERHGRPKAPSRSLVGHDIVMYDTIWDAAAEMTWLGQRIQEGPALRVSTVAAMCAAVGGGAVLGLLPCNMATPDMELLVDPGEIPTREVWMAIHEDLQKVPHVRAAADFIAEVLVPLLV